MNQAKRLHELTKVTNLRLKADKARLAEVLSTESDLRRNLQDLGRLRLQRMDNDAISRDAAFLAAADLNWQLWIDERRKTINTELAKILAQKEECKAILRASFGKDQAAQSLHKAEKLAVKKAAGRRTHYES